MQINIILNDRESSTGKIIKTVESFRTFKIYGERFYIHHYNINKSKLDKQRYIASHEIGLAIAETKALSIDESYNKTRYFLYKIKGKTELLDAVKESKEMLHELIVKKLKEK